MEPEYSEFEGQIEALAALGEPVRRALYLYVTSQDHDVTRDEAAGALKITRSLAVFHLDKLVAEGLLTAQYRRLTGRTGPGAGRPSKLYRRSSQEFQVSLPPRSYELAARIFAYALRDSRLVEAVATLGEVAHGFGKHLGAEAHTLVGSTTDREHLLEAAQALLHSYGFQPERDTDGALQLRNCPFHLLALEHRELVCGMNLALMQGLVDGLQMSGIEAVLDPQPGRCCIVFRCDQSA